VRLVSVDGEAVDYPSRTVAMLDFFEQYRYIGFAQHHGPIQLDAEEESEYPLVVKGAALDLTSADESRVVVEIQWFSSKDELVPAKRCKCVIAVDDGSPKRIVAILPTDRH